MVLFMDGASHYATAQLEEKWTDVNSSGATWAIAAEGRTNGCIKKTSVTNGTSKLTISPFMTQSGPWTPVDTGIFGCAVKITDLTALDGLLDSPSVSDAENAFLAVYYGFQAQVAFTINPNGTISVWKQGGTLLATSIEAIQSDTWVYLEFKWTIADSGSVYIRSNGTQVLAATGIDTRYDRVAFPTPPALWNGVCVLGCDGATTYRMCDVYLADNAGGVNNDFLGDIQVAYIVPDGAGASAAWTPSAGSNWDNQEEVPPDSDTTYVSTSALNNRDSYTFQNVVGDPVAIQICTFVRVESVGAAAVTPVARISAVNYSFNQFGVADVAYTYILQPSDTSPATAAAWTKAEIDATEFGILKTG